MKECDLKTSAFINERLIGHVEKLWKKFKNDNDRGLYFFDSRFAIYCNDNDMMI